MYIGASKGGAIGLQPCDFKSALLNHRDYCHRNIILSVSQPHAPH